MAESNGNNKILAVITEKEGQVAGGVPVFIVPGAKERQDTAFTLEKILDGMVHQLNEHTLLIVYHV
ncbi:hypothetical protein SAMN05444487_104186 [Marininema mesophilum]|uniref:Uncharacterized protein n=1 Tax=Marininema mesophilum TaxID=1048340 RepID=A0A1H2UQN5_9BACL|nr:hypothetical protein [Marininema mesophilum]SDW58437.1 hypothetical protein SAMN05444487_104186 [Marininema mesophilum]